MLKKNIAKKKKKSFKSYLQKYPKKKKKKKSFQSYLQKRISTVGLKLTTVVFKTIYFF